MIDCWLWDLVDCMRHEEDKIPGMNTTYTVKHIQKGPFVKGHVIAEMEFESPLKGWVE